LAVIDTTFAGDSKVTGGEQGRRDTKKRSYGNRERFAHHCAAVHITL